LSEISSRFKFRCQGLDILEKLLRVLADEGLGVVAGDVMPLDSVIVDVVQNSHAGLHGAVDIELRVVRLGHVVGDELSLVAGEGPGLVGEEEAVTACMTA